MQIKLIYPFLRSYIIFYIQFFIYIFIALLQFRKIKTVKKKVLIYSMCDHALNVHVYYELYCAMFNRHIYFIFMGNHKSRDVHNMGIP